VAADDASDDDDGRTDLQGALDALLSAVAATDPGEDADLGDDDADDSDVAVGAAGDVVVAEPDDEDAETKAE
jgi:hypothetical protein